MTRAVREAGPDTNRVRQWLEKTRRRALLMPKR
ncbi:hypothetical protein [Pantoea sp. At-9b]|nr:hypothetical protein [Pantoea sp. At-9b]